MGRKKIIIEPIPEERNRQVTFMKRKAGLLKKAMELSILCQCEVSVIIFSQQDKLFEYASNDMDKMLERRVRFSNQRESKTNTDVSLPAAAPLLAASVWRALALSRSPDTLGAPECSSRICWRRPTTA